ncbi:EKC/KEOPS complex subunit LAGE3-like [Moschus berezovskii]|uniref:EKC/KEOPS complex subunit LAGE3-like n=1 Tax=Moschus berezovskii TaxID=68408 RepID=UPI002444F1FF|nr:EKC/KEOPS complex subunit LAGE3-like [Moschus berezovskii]
MRAADEDAGAEAFAVGTACGGQGVLGGAGGRNGPGDPAVPGDAISRGVPGSSGDMANPRVPGASGESGGAAGAIPQILRTLHAPGPGGDAAPGAGVLINRALQLYPIPGAPVGRAVSGVGVSLTVPFASHEEADIAHHFLTPRTQLRGWIRRELDVNGRVLVLRLTAEDPGLLQTSIAFCLEQLSLVMRNLQHFVPPLYAKPRHRRGA